MYALRTARAATGRKAIVKIEGGYHGGYDALTVSVKPGLDEAGPEGAPVQRGRIGAASRGQQLAQHEGQDAPVPVVVDLDRRVDAQRHRHAAHRAVGPGDDQAAPGREREAALEAERKSVQTRETIQKTQESNPATKKKLSYKEGRELEELEKRIALNEERKASMELEMSQNPSDFVLIQRLDEELKSVTEELEKDMERWAELAEMADL